MPTSILLFINYLNIFIPLVFRKNTLFQKKFNSTIAPDNGVLYLIYEIEFYFSSLI